jgi:calnexin
VLVVLHKASNVPLFAPYREQIDDIFEKAEKNSNITLSALATIPVLLFTLLFRLCFGEKQSVLTTETIKKEDLATADEEATFPGTVDK